MPVFLATTTATNGNLSTATSWLFNEEDTDAALRRAQVNGQAVYPHNEGWQRASSAKEISRDVLEKLIPYAR